MKLSAEAVSRQFMRKSGTSNIFAAVKETSLTINAGELVEITGRSGSGKSTLLNMLAGLLTPTSGKVFLDDADLYAMEDKARSALRNRAIGVVPQGQSGLMSLTVRENILLPTLMYPQARAAGNPGSGRTASGDITAKHHQGEMASDGAKPVAGMSSGAADKTDAANVADMAGSYEEYADMLMERVGITHLKDSYPNELSGGEMRRMAIARALIMRPGVLLCDEPTGDLDDDNTKVVLELLREIADEGVAVLLVTHEREAAAYADRVYRMHDGVLTLESLG